MIASRVERCDPVIPDWQTPSHIRRQNAIDRGIVQRFEKHIALRIRWRRLTEPRQLLDDDMGMADNVPERVYLYRSGHESVLGVCEPTGLEVADRQLNGERGGLGHGCKVWGENELGRWHVVHAWDDAYRGGVT